MMGVYYRQRQSNWGFIVPFAYVWRMGFLIFLGALPFLFIWAAVYVAIYCLALMIALILMVYGMIYKSSTGRDARVPIRSSGTSLEKWMEQKGWVVCRD